jgi:RNA polymerase sigma-70 factor (ECF subfamily)
VRQPGPRREAALADLRAGLLRGLRRALAARGSLDDAFLEDAVQESLLKVLDRLDTFAERGRFVSWAQAISVRVALTMIRKQRWQGVSLDRFREGSSGPAMDVADRSPGPERTSLRSELLAAMHRVIDEQLTNGAGFFVVCASPIGTSRDRWAMHTTRNSRLEFSLQGRVIVFEDRPHFATSSSTVRS